MVSTRSHMVYRLSKKIKTVVQTASKTLRQRSRNQNMSSNMIPLGLNLITHGFDKMSHGFDKIPHHLDNFQQGLDGFPYCCNVSLLLKNIQLYIVACLTDS